MDDSPWLPLPPLLTNLFNHSPENGRQRILQPWTAFQSRRCPSQLVRGEWRGRGAVAPGQRQHRDVHQGLYHPRCSRPDTRINHPSCVIARLPSTLPNALPSCGQYRDDAIAAAQTILRVDAQFKFAEEDPWTGVFEAEPGIDAQSARDRVD